VDCKFTVHFSTSFSTTSFHDAIPKTRLPRRRWTRTAGAMPMAAGEYVSVHGRVRCGSSLKAVSETCWRASKTWQTDPALLGAKSS
jgi:hypothetical protein